MDGILKIDGMRRHFIERDCFTAKAGLGVWQTLVGSRGGETKHGRPLDLIGHIDPYIHYIHYVHDIHFTSCSSDQLFVLQAGKVVAASKPSFVQSWMERGEALSWFPQGGKGWAKGTYKAGIGHNRKSNMTSITAGVECIELKDDGEQLRQRGATSWIQGLRRIRTTHWEGHVSCLFMLDLFAFWGSKRASYRSSVTVTSLVTWT